MRIYGPLFLLLILVSSTSVAQKRFVPGLKLGATASQVDGDTYQGYHKVGPIAGATLSAKFNEKWSAQFEVFYIQKGAKHNGKPDEGDYSFFLMRLNYIEVPWLFQYHQKKFTFDLGPGFGYLISAKEYNFYGEIPGTNPFNSYELNGNIGLNYIIVHNLGISWRFSYSLLPIRNFNTGASYWFNQGQVNNQLSFTLTYKFNGAKTE
jgi:hypothetical protein